MPAVRKKTYKVSVQGPYQVRISLDLDWFRSHGLQAGDEVEQTTMSDGSLVLRPVRKSGS